MKKKKAFFRPPGPAILLVPFAAPLVPPALFLGIMGAPIYGKDLLPGAGGLIDLAALAPRSTPNEYLVAPDDFSPRFPAEGATTTGGGGGARRGPAAPVYDVSVAELEAAFLAVVKAQYTVGAYAEPTLSRAAERRFVFVQRTPLLRFPDVINVQFLAVESGGGEQSTLAVHSGSVFGVDDLGKNRQRVTDWLLRLDDELAKGGLGKSVEAAAAPSLAASVAEAAEAVSEAVADASVAVADEASAAADNVTDAAADASDSVADNSGAASDAVADVATDVSDAAADASNSVADAAEAPLEDEGDVN